MTQSIFKVPTTSDGVNAFGIADLRKRMAVIERNVQAPGTGGSVVDATTLVKGKLQLSGHLAGTAASPIIATTAEPQITRLYVTQAGSTQATFESTGNNHAYVDINNVQGDRHNALRFQDNAVTKWQVGGFAGVGADLFRFYDPLGTGWMDITEGAACDVSPAGLSRFRLRHTNVGNFVNGTLGTRAAGTAVNNDEVNGADGTYGSSFVSQVTWDQPGSWHNFYSIHVIDPINASDSPPSYHESAGYEGSMTVRAKGVLALGMELGLNVEQVSRAINIASILANDVPYSTWADGTIGTSMYMHTGAIGLWSRSQGTANGGTGLLVSSNTAGVWKRAIAVNINSTSNTPGTDVFTVDGATGWTSIGGPAINHSSALSYPLHAVRTTAGTTAHFAGTGAAAVVSIDNSSPSAFGDSVTRYYQSGALKFSVGYRDSIGPVIIPGVTNEPPRVFINWDGAGGGNKDGFIASPTTYPNGTNGARTDSIDDEDANTTGTFWSPFATNPTAFTGKGSLHGFLATFQISDASDGGTPIYREGIGFQTNITCTSEGALIKGQELLLTIVAGKQGRISGSGYTLVEPNTYTSYASLFGGTSEYNDTGARMISCHAHGTKRVGTGIFLTGAGAGFDGAATESRYIRAFVLQDNALKDIAVMDGFGRWGFNITRNQTDNTGAGFPYRINVGYEYVSGVSTPSTSDTEGISFGGSDVVLWRSAAATLATSASFAAFAVSATRTSAGIIGDFNQSGAFDANVQIASNATGNNALLRFAYNTGAGSGIKWTMGRQATTGNFVVNDVAGSTVPLTIAPTTNEVTLLGQVYVNGTAGSGAIRFNEQSSAPGTPASGKAVLYAEASGATTVFKFKDDAGVVSTFAAFDQSLNTTNSPQFAQVGLGQAANTYALSFVASTVATGGIDLGGDVEFFRAAANVAKLNNDSLIVGTATAVTAGANPGAAGVTVVSNGSLLFMRNSAGSIFKSWSNTGHAEPRFQIDRAGVLEWGVGSSTVVDTNLYRSTTATLKTDHALIVTGTLTPLGAFAHQGSTAGFFNATPVVQQTLAAAATDAATTQTLANSLRTALINLGLGV